MKIVLASSSPRRKELLTLHHVDFEVIPSTGEEIIKPNLKVREVVEDISRQKALNVFKDHPNRTILAADTIVTIDNQILGKPKDYNDAVRMLSMLEGKSHEVITGVTLIIDGNMMIFSDVTKVYFKPMTKDDIDYYINHDEVYDKAGSYAIQSEYATFIDHIEGDYENVIGLPTKRVIKELKRMNVI